MAERGGRELQFIQDSFRSYYQAGDSPVEAPRLLSQREFGFLTFGQRFMVRHKGFHSLGGLTSFIRSTTPSDCYFSAAYYDTPTEEMDRKGWLGADLVFDIDADHIATACKSLHDRWICQDCKASGNGSAPEACGRCGSQRLEGEVWFCEACLEAAKAETLKLTDILFDDLGLSPSETKVYFSGHRGYHVHVEEETVRSLDQLGRKEIVDYVTAIGLNLSYHGLKRDAYGVLVGPSLEERGWRRRTVTGLHDIISEASEESLERLGVKRSVAHRIVSQKEAILSSWWDEGHRWDAFRGVGEETWKTLFQGSIEAGKVRALVDSVVTTDIHRLIRLGGSLHGKTGLAKTLVEGSLEGFDPMKGSVAFKGGYVKLFVDHAYRFRLDDTIYGPFEKSLIELPLAPALLLLCKGLATLT